MQDHKKNVLITTCFKDYISECTHARNLRPATIKGYVESFSNYMNLMPHLKRVCDLRPEDMTTFYQRLNLRPRKGKIGVKNSTLYTYYNKLMVFFRWLEAKGYIEEGSLSKKVTKPSNPRYEDEKALSPNEVASILSAISISNIDNEFQFARDMVIIYLLLYTGIRKGELLGLRTCDVNFSTNSIFINGRTSKSKHGRFIPMHQNLSAHIKSYFSILASLGFSSVSLLVSRTGAAFTKYGIKYWIKKYKKLTGIPIHLHRFRHTFACELAKKNADIISIRNVMGHTSCKVTEGYLRSIKSESSRSYINDLSY